MLRKPKKRIKLWTKEMVCITCPLGCLIALKMRGNKIMKISGAQCKKGEEYVKEEIKNPRRILTTTVQIENGILPQVPVRSKEPLPKKKLNSALKILAKIKIKAPVKMGEVVVKNILNTGIDIIATRDLPC